MRPEMTVNWFDDRQKEQQQDDYKISAEGRKAEHGSKGFLPHITIQWRK